jgi:hypothetical protein
MLLVFEGCARIGQRSSERLKFYLLQSGSNVISDCKLCWNWSVLFLNVADCASCSQDLM